jgi:hypothetical protein
MFAVYAFIVAGQEHIFTKLGVTSRAQVAAWAAASRPADEGA